MSIVFIDGFDAYQTGQIGLKWDSLGGSLAVGSPYGRYGSQGLRIADAGYVSKVLVPSNKFVVGFAFRVGATMDSDQRVLCAFSSVGVQQCELRITSSNQLQFTRQGTAITGGLAGSVLSPGVTYFCDLKATFSNSISAGDVVVRIGGVPVITLPAGSNVVGAGGTTANQVQIGHGPRGLFATNYDVSFDDLYILDGNGTANNDFIGDNRVELLVPTATASLANFVNVGGASAVASVTDNPPDNDTSYIESNTPGDKETFNFTDLSTVPRTIAGIQFSTVGRKDDAGTRVMSSLLKIGGVEYLGPNYGLNDSYVLNRTVFEVNPATTAAWLPAEITALEAGFKLVV